MLLSLLLLTYFLTWLQVGSKNGVIILIVDIKLNNLKSKNNKMWQSSI